jgi:ribosome-binding factor A
VGELIRAEIAAFLTAEARDPRIGFVTITGVEVSPDLSHANVHVSVMGTEEEKARTLEGLSSAARFLRAHLAKGLHLRVAPEVAFHLDRGIEYGARIDAVLRDLKEGGG